MRHREVAAGQPFLFSSEGLEPEMAIQRPEGPLRSPISTQGILARRKAARNVCRAAVPEVPNRAGEAVPDVPNERHCIQPILPSVPEIP